MQDGVTAATEHLQGGAGELAKRAREVVAGIFSAILSLVLIFMLTGFLLYDAPRLSAWLKRLVPEEYREGVSALMRDIDRGLSGAVRGQLGVCLVNGVLTAAGLLVLNVKFAITLGVMAGIFSLIPVFGTLVSTIPAMAVGLTQSPLTAALVLAWVLIIHLLEANVLNPKIIGYNAELHPALVVLALLLGEHYGGAVGLLIAVPVATVVRSLMTYTLGRVLVPRHDTDKPEPVVLEEDSHFEGTVTAIAPPESAA
jgi:predicted PurR-regulated permease PerM